MVEVAGGEGGRKWRVWLFEAFSCRFVLKFPKYVSVNGSGDMINFI